MPRERCRVCNGTGKCERAPEAVARFGSTHYTCVRCDGQGTDLILEFGPSSAALGYFYDPDNPSHRWSDSGWGA